MKDDLAHGPVESILASDEWIHFRYLIEEELKGHAINKEIKTEKLPFMGYFEGKIKERLLNAGFQKEIIEDPEELKSRITVLNKDAVIIYLRSLEMIINLARSGNIAEFSKSKDEAESESEKTHEVKMRIMRRAISHIFDVKPSTQKAIGDVWKEFDAVNKNVKFKLRESDTYRLGKGTYTVERGKDKNGDDVIHIFKDDDFFSDYAKKSLQQFIDELKF